MSTGREVLVPREWVLTLMGEGHPLVPRAVMPHWCLWKERREGCTPLSHCCSLFVPLSLAAVALVPVRREGLAATQTGALSLSRYCARLLGWLGPSPEAT